MLNKSLLMCRAWALHRQSTAPYSRAGAPASWSGSKHRSNDLMRLANVEAILRTEKAAAGLAATYTAKRDGAAYVLKRDGIEFGRLIGPADRLAFTSTDAALAERVRAAFVPWAGVPAALAKVRAADEALRLAGIV